MYKLSGWHSKANNFLKPAKCVTDSKGKVWHTINGQKAHHVDSYFTGTPKDWADGYNQAVNDINQGRLKIDEIDRYSIYAIDQETLDFLIERDAILKRQN